MTTTRTSPVSGNTIVGAFRNNVRRMPDRVALRRRVGDAWETLSWSRYGQAVAEVTAGLAELGVEPGHAAGIFSNNRVEWHVADFGTLANGSVTVPVYQTSSAQQVAHMLGNSEAVLCFVENLDLASRILEAKSALPRLERIVVFDDDGLVDDPFVIGFAQLLAIGAARLEREPGLFVERADAVAPGQLATLVYTSGTTGPPKGAMVDHANIMWTLESAISLLDIGDGERLLSFLPLSHIAERMISDFAAVAVGAETWFARGLSTVAEDLRDCRPTVFFGVPRVWEKLHDAVAAKLEETHGLKRFVVNGYVGLGERVVADHESGNVPVWESFPYEALDASIGAKIRHDIGLDEARVLISAAAPIHPDLIRWFHAIGLPLIELYGQTETCGPTTSNSPKDFRIGTVGRPIPGVEVRIADDGEILVRGGNVCAGYFHDAIATAELIDEDGWMHSGDAGRFDGDGYLVVTGRKKDLIITAAGQNIAPQEIERDLRQHELISEAVVVGEGHRYLTALLTLDADALTGWAEARHKFADIEVLTTDPDLNAELDAFIDHVNRLRSRVEHIRKYRVLPHDFTIASGELTPTLKVKRNVVNADYRALIDEMYAEGPEHT